MKNKLLSLMLVLSIVMPSIVQAGEASNRIKYQEEEVAEVVKEVPPKFAKEVGENFLLIDESYLRDLIQAAEERDVFEVKFKDVLADLEKHRIYAAGLEEVIESDNRHMAKLNKYIDDQDKVIDSLRPTFWDKHKFMVGLVTGMLLTGAAAYGASQLD